MSVESDIFDTLKVLVSNRCYPDVAPSGAAKPYITYQQVGGEPVAFLENTLPSKKNGRFQVNVWGASRLSVNTLARQVEAAMYAATVFQARPTGDLIATFNEDVSLYGSIQDFTVWSDR